MTVPLSKRKSQGEINNTTKPPEYFLKPGRGLECLNSGNADYCNEASSLRKSLLGDDYLVELLGIRRTSSGRGSRRRSSQRQRKSSAGQKSDRRRTTFKTDGSGLGNQLGDRHSITSTISLAVQPTNATSTQLKLASERAWQIKQNFVSTRIVSIHGERLLSCLKLIGKKLEILGILPQLISRLVVGDEELENAIGEECTHALLQLLYIQTAWLLQRSQSRPESEFFLGQTLRQIKRKLQKGVRARTAKLTFKTEHTVGEDAPAPARSVDHILLKSKSEDKCKQGGSDGSNVKRLPKMSCFRTTKTRDEGVNEMEKMEKLQNAIDEYGERCEYTTNTRMRSRMLEHTIPNVATPAEKIFRDIFYQPIVQKRINQKRIKLRVCRRKNDKICCRPYSKSLLKGDRKSGMDAHDMIPEDATDLRMKSPLDAFLSDQEDEAETSEGVLEEAAERNDEGAAETYEAQDNEGTEEESDEEEQISNQEEEEEQNQVKEATEELNICSAAPPSEKQVRLAILEEILEHPGKYVFLQRLLETPMQRSFSEPPSAIPEDDYPKFSMCSTAQTIYQKRIQLVRRAVEGSHGKNVLRSICTENLQSLLHFIQLDKRKRMHALRQAPASCTRAPIGGNAVEVSNFQWRKRWKHILSLQEEALATAEKPKRGWNLTKDRRTDKFILVKHFKNSKGQWQSKKIRLNARGEPETPLDKLKRRIEKVKRKINRRLQIRKLRDEFGAQVPRGAFEKYSRMTLNDEEDDDSAAQGLELQEKVIKVLGNKPGSQGGNENFIPSSDDSVSDSDYEQNMDVVVTHPYPFKQSINSSKPRTCLNPDSALTDYLGIPPESDSYKLGYIPVLLAGYNMGRIAALELPLLGPESFGILPETYHIDQLRGSYKEVFRLINLKPNIPAYIFDQIEPDISLSLQVFCNEIRTLQTLMFARLIISPEDEVNRVNLLKQTWIREQRLLKLLSNLKEEYTNLEKKKEIMLTNLNESINNFIGQIDNAYLHTHQEIVKTIADYTKMELVTTKSADHTLQELHSILQKCVTAASVMRAKYAEAEEKLQKQKRKLEAELDVLISQYDTEMFARQEQLDKLVEDENNNKKELNKIEQELHKVELKFSAMQDELRLKQTMKKKKNKSKKKKGKKGKKKRKRGKSKRKGKKKGKSKGKKKRKKGKKKKLRKAGGTSSDEKDESEIEDEETETDASKTDSEAKKKKSKKSKGIGVRASTKSQKTQKKGSKKTKKTKKKKDAAGETTEEEEVENQEGELHVEDVEDGEGKSEEEVATGTEPPQKIKGKTVKGEKTKASKSTSAPSNGEKRKKKKTSTKRKGKKSKKRIKRGKGRKNVNVARIQTKPELPDGKQGKPVEKVEAETGAETEGDFNEPPTPPELDDVQTLLSPGENDTDTRKRSSSDKHSTEREDDKIGKTSTGSA